MKFKIMYKRYAVPLERESFMNGENGFCSVKAAQKALDKAYKKITDNQWNESALTYFIRKEE
jgi:hypothetical protein